MTAFEDVWSGSALKALAELSAHAQDQVEALVRGVCVDPVGSPLEGLGRTRVARSGVVRVLFQVDVVGELVYVVRVEVV